MRRFAITASAARANRSKASDTLIRPAGEADAGAIAEVHVASWRAAYQGLMSDEFLAGLSVERRAVMWRESIARGNPQMFVAERTCGQAPPRLQGWIAFERSRDAGVPAGTGEVWAFYVHPDVWSTGAGRGLWAGALDSLRSRGFHTVHVWVLSANDRARRFYWRQGLASEPGQIKSVVMGGSQLEEIRYTGALGWTAAPGG